MIEAFPQPSCLLFFLEQITDRQIDFLPWLLRYPAQCTGLEPLPESPQNKVCHRLHPEYTPFSCLPIICLSAIWKYLFLRNWSYLRHFWYLEGSWLNVIPSFCRQLLLPADYSLVHFMKVKVLMYPKGFTWCCATFGCVASSRGHYL